MKKFLNKVEAHEVESGLDKLLKESKNIGNNPDVKPATEEISSVTGGDYVKRPNGELWNDVWFENELCIMYAAVDDVLSQSIFAVLIADELNLTDKVLIFDLAWVQHQLVDRYSDINGQHYRFSDNLYRFEHTNHYCEFCDEMETEIRDNLEFAVKSSGAKILIFDNLPDKCEFAYQMMQILINLKKKYGLSVLCLVRTPKRDMSVPIEYSEYTGSMALIDFCDSAVVIGKSSRGKSVRYVKQIKSRNNKIEYGSDNVVLYNIVKEDGIYLRFDFNGHGTERDHLVKTRKKNRQK